MAQQVHEERQALLVLLAPQAYAELLPRQHLEVEEAAAAVHLSVGV